MLQMSDRAFLDTNILVYLYSKDDDSKRSIARRMIDDYDCVTSIQAMNESSNVWLKKFSLSSATIKDHLNNIEAVCDDVLRVHRVTIDSALNLKDRYGFSYYDCLMLASAIEADCQVIFTEDMSDGQVIDGFLKIVNPFKLSKHDI